MKTTVVGAVAGLLLLVLLVVGVAAAVTGRLPWAGSGSTRPACELLRPKAEVDRELAAHAGLADRVRAAGPGVTVAATDVCGDEHKGIITVTYDTDAERAAVEAELNSEGFGADVELVSR